MEMLVSRIRVNFSISVLTTLAVWPVQLDTPNKNF